MAEYRERMSLLSSQARIQAPWIKVTIGDFTFGVFGRKNQAASAEFTKAFAVQYPSYVKSLNIIKINGQVNQYSLQLTYPVRSCDDPNLIEKVLSSVTSTRKIVFSYGDASAPAYVYKDEEAIITDVQQSFVLESSTIEYTIKAVSGCALAASGAFTFQGGKKKPSDEIKKLFKNSRYGLRSLFKGMGDNNLNALVAGDDQAVELEMKTNISPLDYLTYLVSCMIPAGSSISSLTNDIYILTLHDETILDQAFSDKIANGGPYFKVTRVSNSTKQKTDAYVIDVGYNTATIVRSFSIENRENFAMLYDYSSKLTPEQYSLRLNTSGQWEQTFAPAFTSKNDRFLSRTEDRTWYSKLTKYPISATIQVQGLLRPASLMQYVRLNVVFPGGNKHISSGLYIVTKQVDDISSSGYITTLSLTRIGGDD